jgi:hypothetical protein
MGTYPIEVERVVARMLDGKMESLADRLAG